MVGTVPFAYMRRRAPSVQADGGLPRRVASLVAVLFLGGLLFGVPLAAHAQMSEVCERALPAADDQYREAAYGEALRLVSACLNQSDRSDEQSVAAYRLLALIHLKRDELDQARAAVVNLLGLTPGYEPDPVASPPSYVSLVTVVKEDLKSRVAADSAQAAPARTPFFRRTSTWVTIGGLLVGGGVAAVVAGGGGGGGGGAPVTGPDALPLPPGTP